MHRILFHSFFKSVLVTFCLLGLVHSAFASTVVMPSDDDLIVGARAIIRGRVVSMSAALDKDDSIYTYVTLRVDEVLKGEVASREIVIKQEGGRVGDRTDIIYGSPEFTIDEDVLLYLDTRRDGSLRVHQMALGKFSIVGDPSTGHQFAVRSGFDNAAVSLPTHAHSNQTSTAVTNRMELNAYLDMVRVRFAANQEASNTFLDMHYRNVPMLEKPAEYEGALIRGDLQPAFTTISSLNPRWFEPDAGLAVVFAINPDGAPNAQITGDIVAAMNAWSTVSGNPLRVELGGNTSACGPSSGQNTIIFNGCDGRWSPSPTCQGTLAVGGLSITGPSIIIGGVTYFRATRGFISFNPFASCFFGNSCNVREITTHELGHALGLGHSQFSVATMFFQAHFDGRCAGIKQDDIDGINFLYIGPSGGGGGPLTITTSSPLASGVQGTFYSQTMAASGGQSPYTWSLVSGQLPAGLSLSPGGAITGVPSATGTSNFTIRVTDSASATAQQAFSLTISAIGQPDSQFISGTVPSSVQPGQAFNVTLRWLNTGAESWTGSSGFSLRSQNPPNNLTWGGNTVSLNTFFITPGQQLNVTFTAFAPQTPGTYNFQWQLWKTGLEFFGEPSLNVAIQVGSSCTFTISPSSQSFSSSGGTGSVGVSTQTGCAWTAVSNAPWISVTSGSSGTGSGSVNYSVSANSGAFRTGTMTVAGQTFTVSQSAGSPSCTFTISPSNQSFSSSGGTGSVNVSTQTGCAWTAVSNAPWISVTSGSSGTGSGSVNYSVSSNSGAARTGTMTVAGQTFTVSQAAAPTGCSVTISPASRSFGIGGGGGTISVFAPSGCSWTAVSNENWIFVSAGAGGTGNGGVKYTVGLNIGPSRTGTITVGDQTHTVTQTGSGGSCTFTISPSSQSFSSSGGTGSVNVSTQTGCAWTAVSNAPWISVTSGSSGTGSGSANYFVSANSGAFRTGTMTVAGQTFTVSQAGGSPSCTFTISPSSQNFSSSGGTGSVNVSTQTGCAWTAVSNAPWISITSGSSGTGSGSVNYSVSANTVPAARAGTMTVAGQTFTVTQAAGSSGCTFTISPGSQNFSSSGGTGSVNVSTQTGCAWTAVSNAPWISITSGSSGTGSGSVNYSVSANTDSNPRTGTMTIAGQTFTVTQEAASGSCSVNISSTSKSFPKLGGSGTVNVTAPGGCSWAVTSNVSWIAILSGSGGSGNGTVVYAVSFNIGGPRTGTITIGNKTFTVTQQ